MEQLETLEAKMAKIELSLTAANRKRKGSLARSRETVTKMMNASKLKNQMPTENNSTMTNDDDDDKRSEKIMVNGSSRTIFNKIEKQTEEKILTLHRDIQNKQKIINNLKTNLDKFNASDNIDIRIQQAELEYHLSREELELLTLLEKNNGFNPLIKKDGCPTMSQEESTIFSYINKYRTVTLHAIEMEYNHKNPQFDVCFSMQDGLCCNWAFEKSKILKGDRIIEINGTLVLSTNKEDMLKLLNNKTPTQIVFMRTKYITNYNTSHYMQTNNNLNQSDLDSLKNRVKEMKYQNDKLHNENKKLISQISHLEKQTIKLRSKKESKSLNVSLSDAVSVMDESRENITNISIASEPDFNILSSTSSSIQELKNKSNTVPIILDTNNGHIKNSNVTKKENSLLSNICDIKNGIKRNKSERKGIICAESFYKNDHIPINSLQSQHILSVCTKRKNMKETKSNCLPVKLSASQQYNYNKNNRAGVDYVNTIQVTTENEIHGKHLFISDSKKNMTLPSKYKDSFETPEKCSDRKVNQSNNCKLRDTPILQCKRIVCNNKPSQYTNKTSGQNEGKPYSKSSLRTNKNILDFDSEPTKQYGDDKTEYIDYTSEPYCMRKKHTRRKHYLDDLKYYSSKNLKKDQNEPRVYSSEPDVNTSRKFYLHDSFINLQLNQLKRNKELHRLISKSAVDKIFYPYHSPNNLKPYQSTKQYSGDQLKYSIPNVIDSKLDDKKSTVEYFTEDECRKSKCKVDNFTKYDDLVLPFMHKIKIKRSENDHAKSMFTNLMPKNRKSTKSEKVIENYHLSTKNYEEY